MSRKRRRKSQSSKVGRDADIRNVTSGLGVGGARTWKLVLLACVAVAMVLAGRWAWRFLSPAHAPVVFERMETLDPALTDLIVEHVALVRQAPRDASRHATLGIIYEANELWPEARQAFDIAFQLDRGEPLWAYHAALARWNCGDIEDAVHRLERLARTHDTFAPAIHRLGCALLEQGRLAAAEKHFRRCMSLVGEAPEVLAGIAAVKIYQDAPGEAARLLERAVSVDPHYKLLHYQLGLAYRSLGRLADAELELAMGLGASLRYLSDEATIRSSQYVRGASASLAQAIAYGEMGQHAAAIKLLERACKGNPADLGLMMGLSEAYRRTGQYDRSLSLLGKAERIGRNLHQVYTNTAGLLTTVGRHQEALDYTGRAIELAPAVFESHMTRAHVLVQLERLADAEASLRDALRCKPRSAEAYAMLGQVNVAQGRLHNAQEQFRRAVHINPALLWAHMGLYAVSMQVGDREDAAAALALAERLAPNHPQVVAMRAQWRE